MILRWLWRLLLVLGTFVAVGYLSARALVAHAVAKGTPEYSVRLGGAMGGLFAGGAAAMLVAVALLTLRRRPSGKG